MLRHKRNLFSHVSSAMHVDTFNHGRRNPQANSTCLDVQRCMWKCFIMHVCQSVQPSMSICSLMHVDAFTHACRNVHSCLYWVFIQISLSMHDQMLSIVPLNNNVDCVCSERSIAALSTHYALRHLLPVHIRLTLYFEMECMTACNQPKMKNACTHVFISAE